MLTWQWTDYFAKAYNILSDDYDYVDKGGHPVAI